MTALALATFDGEGPYLRARTRAIGAGHRLAGEWLPYALELPVGQEGAQGIRGWAIAAGVLGGGGLLALTAWSALLAYPFNTGGRPMWSWPAFLAAPVEFGALTAGIGGLVLLFVRAGLTRLHHPAFDFDEVGRASRDAFVLAVRCDAGADANRLLALLAEAGATHTRLIAP